MDQRANYPGPNYEIKPLHPSELHLVCNAWHLSLVPPPFKGRKRKPSPDPRFREMTVTDAHTIIGAEIDDVLARYPLILVARQDGVVLSWLCAEATDAGVVVHYAFTKSPYRRQGIGRALLGAACTQLAPLSGPGLFYRYQTLAEPIAVRYGFERVC